MTSSNVFPSAPSAFGNIDQTSFATWVILLLSESFSSRPVQLSAVRGHHEVTIKNYLFRLFKAREKEVVAI